MHVTIRRRLMAMAIMVLMGILPLTAQRGGGARGGGPPQPAQARAPVDFTGYWVSVVTEDWRWRMVTPPKGDFVSVPLNAEGRNAAFAWDLAKDIADGNQCRAFGVGGIMRMPGRLHITWQDPNTVKIETDAGTQTRLLRFGGAERPSGEKTWQGWSVAEWDYGELIAVSRVTQPSPGVRGSLKAVTTGMRAGYLRKNGLPYSEDAVITEYFDRDSNSPDGAQWFHVMTIVDDPKNLTQPFVTNSIFKKEPDASKWHPTPCETAPPTVPPVTPAGGRAGGPPAGGRAGGPPAGGR